MKKKKQLAKLHTFVEAYLSFRSKSPNNLLFCCLSIPVFCLRDSAILLFCHIPTFVSCTRSLIDLSTYHLPALFSYFEYLNFLLSC